MIVSPWDPLALFALGVVIAIVHRTWLSRRNDDWVLFLAGATVLAFWFDLVLAHRLATAPWGALPAVQTESLALAIGYALAYPFWIRLGTSLIFLLVGRDPTEGGVLWVYRIEDHTADFDSRWES
jgi:hypothetical protein